MSRFKLLDRLRGSVLAGSVGTSASEDKLLSSRESHPGVIPAQGECLGGQRRLPPHRRISCCPRASRIPATRSPLLVPADKGVGRQLGTVVETEGGGPPVQRDEFVENPDHAPSRNRPADIDRQTFAIPLAVERLVQGFDTEAGVERV